MEKDVKWVCCPKCGTGIKLFKLNGTIVGSIEKKCRCCKQIISVTGEGIAKVKTA